MNAERLLQRFLEYVRIDTTAGLVRVEYPSSPGQLELGRLLVEQLREMGLKDAQQSPYGIVTATLAATISRPTPIIGLNAHLDTSPETTGKNVRPQVWRNYDGKDLVLPGDRSRVLRVSENPELASLKGKTIITTDGTTLLGSDDKSGVAVIMETAQWLLEHPEIPHGPVRLFFTCDEEIGQGVEHVEIADIGAVAAYTVDGFGTDTIDVETFSANMAVIVVRGVNIHPSIGKGKLVNAMRGAADFIAKLPRDHLAPEVTDGREGFVHPYHIEGSVAEVRMRVLLRDFETAKLETQAKLLHTLAREVEKQHPGISVDVDIRPQYRNPAEGLKRDARIVELAEEAYRRLGRKARRTVIRGGTDGSLLTAKGLPSPNLAVGQHNPHSVLEWTCLEEMVLSGEVLVELVKLWGEQVGMK